MLQSLLLLRQSYCAGVLPDVGLALNGELANIGTGGDGLGEQAQSDSLGFELVDEHGQNACWEFAVTPAASVLSLVSGPDESGYGASLFGDRFRYVGPEGVALVELRGEIGTSRLGHPSLESLDLELEAQAWLAEINPHSDRNSRAWSIITSVLP
ncbi:hypothetical protein NG795_26850 [Laspinema sp. D3]|nr:hypothetical protein [Laspinema sp. D2c]